MQADLTPREQRAARGLGRTQRLVLHTLANQGACSARDLAYHWYGVGLTESAATAAVDRLARRGLVDLGPGSFNGARFVRSFVLTDRGELVEQTLDEVLDEDEVADQAEDDG